MPHVRASGRQPVLNVPALTDNAALSVAGTTACTVECRVSYAVAEKCILGWVHCFLWVLNISMYLGTIVDKGAGLHAKAPVPVPYASKGEGS